MGCGASKDQNKVSDTKLKEQKQPDPTALQDEILLQKTEIGERKLGDREKKIIEEGVSSDLLKNLSPSSDKILFMYLRMGSKQKYEDHLNQRQLDLAKLREELGDGVQTEDIWNGKGKVI
jgi:hypothetical protein